VEQVPGYATNLQQRVESWINDPPQLIRRVVRLLSLGSHTNSPVATNSVATNDLRSDGMTGTLLSTGAVAPGAIVPLTNAYTRATTGEVALTQGASNGPPGLTNGGPAAPTLQAARLKDVLEMARSWGIELDPKLFTSATGWVTGMLQKVAPGSSDRWGVWRLVWGLVGVSSSPSMPSTSSSKASVRSGGRTTPLARSHLKDELAFVIGSSTTT
jgi:hypothetical protein